jgi:predicted MPP superfamily phosphohydrolase
VRSRGGERAAVRSRDRESAGGEPGGHGGAQRGHRPARSRRASGGLGAFLATVVAWQVLCWAIVGGLLAPVVPGGWWTVVVTAVAALSPLAALVLGFRRRLYPGALFRLWVLRPFWYSQLLLPLLAASGLVGAVAGVPFGVAGTAGRAAMAVVLALAALVGMAGYAGSRRLVVREVVASWPELPAALDGVRIAQVSDVHVGPHTPRGHLARVARAVRDAAPDLVAVTGDLVDDHAADVAHYAAGLGALAAPLGVYAIPGNHDVYAGWASVRAGLERLPLTVLVNESRVVERNGARLAIVGTGDPAGRRGGAERAAPDLPTALAGVPPGAFAVVLAHNPALWPALAERGVPLTLSGHTHWGQFALPSLGWSLATPFLEHSMGTYERGRSLLYIHPGTNYWGIPFRLGTPPEVAVVTLRRGPLGVTRAPSSRPA